MNCNSFFKKVFLIRKGRGGKGRGRQRRRGEERGGEGRIREKIVHKTEDNLISSQQARQ
jgi:hypothetical protein